MLAFPSKLISLLNSCSVEGVRKAMPVKDYSYEWMLDRVYSKVPVKLGGGERFVPPKPQIVYIPGKTIIKNFSEITDKLRREPRLLMRYLLKELAAPGSIDDTGALVIHGKFSASAINVLLNRFIKTYVICPNCGRPDTVLKKKGKVWILVCEACGAEQPVKPF